MRRLLFLTFLVVILRAWDIKQPLKGLHLPNPFGHSASFLETPDSEGCDNKLDTGVPVAGLESQRDIESQRLDLANQEVNDLKRAINTERARAAYATIQNGDHSAGSHGVAELAVAEEQSDSAELQSEEESAVVEAAGGSEPTYRNEDMEKEGEMRDEDHDLKAEVPERRRAEEVEGPRKLIEGYVMVADELDDPSQTLGGGPRTVTLEDAQKIEHASPSVMDLAFSQSVRRHSSPVVDDGAEEAPAAGHSHHHHRTRDVENSGVPNGNKSPTDEPTDAKVLVARQETPAEDATEEEETEGKTGSRPKMTTFQWIYLFGILPLGFIFIMTLLVFFT